MYFKKQTDQNLAQNALQTIYSFDNVNIPNIYEYLFYLLTIKPGKNSNKPESVIKITDFLDVNSGKKDIIEKCGYILNNVSNMNTAYDFIYYGKVPPILINLALYSLSINLLQIEKGSANSYITPSQLYNIIFQTLEIPSLQEFIPDISQSDYFRKEQKLNNLFYQGVLAELLGTVSIGDTNSYMESIDPSCKVINFLWDFYQQDIYGLPFSNSEINKRL